ARGRRARGALPRLVRRGLRDRPARRRRRRRRCLPHRRRARHGRGRRVSWPDPRAGGDAFIDFLGMRFEPGAVRLTIRPELLNSNGKLLGPVGFALIDYGMAAELFAATTT